MTSIPPSRYSEFGIPPKDSYSICATPIGFRGGLWVGGPVFVTHRLSRDNLLEAMEISRKDMLWGKACILFSLLSLYEYDLPLPHLRRVFSTWEHSCNPPEDCSVAFPSFSFWTKKSVALGRARRRSLRRSLNCPLPWLRCREGREGSG